MLKLQKENYYLKIHHNNRRMNMENYLEKWNPLEIISMNAEENYRQLAISSTKQQIRNILKSYVGYYDPFCELLQNAMDATDRMAHIVGDKYRKKLKIYIDLSKTVFM